MSEIQKVTTHRLVVGATPDIMEAARSAAAEIVRDFYADAIRKGRCDSDEIVLVAARAILDERERCAEIADNAAKAADSLRLAAFPDPRSSFYGTIAGGALSIAAAIRETTR